MTYQIMSKVQLEQNCRHNKWIKQAKMALLVKCAILAGKRLSKNERKMRENEIRRLDYVGETRAVELSYFPSVKWKVLIFNYFMAFICVARSKILYRNLQLDTVNIFEFCNVQFLPSWISSALLGWKWSEEMERKEKEAE